MLETIIKTPTGAYELLDFGAGRKLERLGTYILDTPAPSLTMPRVLATNQWHADWVFQTHAAIGEWHPQRPDLPTQWEVNVEGFRLPVLLAADGSYGFQAEQIAAGAG